VRREGHARLSLFFRRHVRASSGQVGTHEDQPLERIGQPRADRVEVQRQAGGVDDFPERLPVWVIGRWRIFPTVP
jgi:hypothetical protein